MKLKTGYALVLKQLQREPGWKPVNHTAWIKDVLAWLVNEGFAKRHAHGGYTATAKGREMLNV